jgi:hypothetical protein
MNAEIAGRISSHRCRTTIPGGLRGSSAEGTGSNDVCFMLSPDLKIMRASGAHAA